MHYCQQTLIVIERTLEGFFFFFFFSFFTLGVNGMFLTRNQPENKCQNDVLCHVIRVGWYFPPWEIPIGKYWYFRKPSGRLGKGAMQWHFQFSSYGYEKLFAQFAH